MSKLITQTYLTDEDYKKAEENGINRNNAYARFYVYGWSVEDTISKPVKDLKDTAWHKHKELAEKNGIKQNTFYGRIHKGMTPYEAATTPKKKFGGFAGKRVITDEMIAIAASNGISEATLRHRYYSYNWDLERAYTESIDATKNWRKKNEDSSFRHFGQLQRR